MTLCDSPLYVCPAQGSPRVAKAVAHHPPSITDVLAAGGRQSPTVGRASVSLHEDVPHDSSTKAAEYSASHGHGMAMSLGQQKQTMEAYSGAQVAMASGGTYATLQMEAASALNLATRERPVCLQSCFEPMKLISNGAFTEVWTARDTASGATVALKRIAETIWRGTTQYEMDARRIALAELENETRVLAMLDHAAIVKLLAYVQQDGVPAAVYELADACFLDKLIDFNDEHEIKDCVAQAAEGLAYLHEKGIVHGDIKPDNMLIYGFSLKICDFGIAGRVGAIREGKPRGTTQYMAPELLLLKAEIQAAPEEVHRYALETEIDTWAFGILLYAALIGDLPWEIADAEVDRKYANFESISALHNTIACVEPWSAVHPRLMRCMCGMLSPSSAGRPPMTVVASVVRGPWIKLEEPDTFFVQPELTPSHTTSPAARADVDHVTTNWTNISLPGTNVPWDPSPTVASPLADLHVLLADSDPGAKLPCVPTSTVLTDGDSVGHLGTPTHTDETSPSVASTSMERLLLDHVWRTEDHYESLSESENEDDYELRVDNDESSAGAERQFARPATAPASIGRRRNPAW